MDWLVQVLNAISALASAVKDSPLAFAGAALALIVVMWLSIFSGISGPIRVGAVLATMVLAVILLTIAISPPKGGGCGFTFDRSAVLDGGAAVGLHKTADDPENNVELCRQSCIDDNQCVAWSAGRHTGNPNCHLFHKTPMPRLSNDAQGAVGFILPCAIKRR